MRVGGCRRLFASALFGLAAAVLFREAKPLHSAGNPLKRERLGIGFSDDVCKLWMLRIGELDRGRLDCVSDPCLGAPRYCCGS